MRHHAATLPLALLSLAISSQLYAQSTTSVQQLDTVSVNATRAARSVAEIAGTVYRIDHAQVAQQIAAGRSTADILGQLVPSLAPASGTTSNYGTTMRGRSVQVMIDGVPLTGARDGSRQLNSISPTMIERIEVISGATALYGAGASGGIINIITLQPGEQPLALATQVGLRSPSDVDGDNLAWNLAQTLTFRSGTLSGAAGINYARQGASLDADGRRIGPEIAQTDRQDTETKEFNSRLDWNPDEKQQLSVGLRWYDDQQDSDYGPDYGPRLAVLFNPAYAPSHLAVKGLQLDDQPRTRHQGINSQYRNRDILGGHELSVEAYYRNEKGRWFPSVSAAVHPALPGGFAYVAMQSNTDIDVWGVRSALHKAFDVDGRALQLSYGVDHEREKDSQLGQTYDITAFIASNGLNYVPTQRYAMGPDVRVDTTGLFLQGDYPLTERVTVQAGVRHQILHNRVADSLPYTEAIAATANPTYVPKLLEGGNVRHSQTLFNAGVVYKVADGQQLFANFSQGFSLPDTQRMLRDVPASFVIDSRNIGPIKVNNYELGWRRSDDAVLQGGVTAFYNNSDKTVQFNRDYSVSVADTDERVWGVEANLRYLPNEQWEFGASVASTRGQYKDANGQWRELNAFRVSPLKAGLYGQWRFATDSLLRLQGQAVGGTDHAWRDAQVTAFSPTIRATPSAKISGYAVFDLLAEIPLGVGRFSAGIYNLADRDYKTVYGQQAAATYGQISSVAAQGRTFGIGYRWEY
ncbi:TonB-dependent receptor [Stenotrophomonas sp. STM01]|uniref:TonB-dependent receptor n=1 Tax=Stenotrophomonas sp. STM01 TaxID=2769278 RepID=UPI001781883E|nr:TonB-dependent receptor [Stenotrophomonas sp. STM01]MBD9537513.1 TonB-dependent receptor [Stenotrophomonas sp. STM01]